jgi:hypothetical protein
MVVVDSQGIPLGSTIVLASPQEVMLVDKVIAQVRGPRNIPGRSKSRPKRFFGTRTYDSDASWKNSHNYQIELICSQRINRKKH